MLKLASSKNKIISGMYRYCVACFLAALAAMLLLLPFLEQVSHGERLMAGVFTIVLLFAVAAVGNSRKTLFVAILLVAPALASKWLHHFFPDIVPAEWAILFGLIFVLFVIWHLFSFILRAPRVNSEVLCAAVATYLMIGLLWSFVYVFIAEVAPDSFVFSGNTAQTMKGFNALYFSFITLCTVGYGDIVPVSGAARAMAMMEGTVGVFYIATVVSRLVAMYSSEKKQ